MKMHAEKPQLMKTRRKFIFNKNNKNKKKNTYNNKNKRKKANQIKKYI
jgi:hypothetical protein